MRRIWRKWVCLALGLLAVPAAASEPIGVADARPRQIIAQTPTPEVIEKAAASASVGLDRPRPLPATDAIEQTAFSTAPQSVVRGQVADVTIPGPVTTTIPSQPVRSSVINATPGQTYVPGPTMVGAPELVADGDMGMDPNRFAAGDGVVQQFNNLVWLKSEYLRWTLRGSSTPPLLTVDATTATSPGVIGNGTSSVVFGNTRDDTEHSGYRFTGGFWFDCDHCIGLEGVFFFQGEETNSLGAMSTGSPILALPFNNAANVPSATVIAGRGGAGMANAVTNTRMWGAEANLKSNILVGPCAHVDALIGFRVAGLDDSLDLTTNSAALLPSTSVTLSDRFAARNRFYGGQLGLHGEARRGRWSLDVLAKIALGTTNQEVTIDGTTSAAGATTRGGFYTINGVNIGQFTRDEFSIIPEVGITIGYQVTDNLRVSAGYNFLYWTNVARSGEQVNTSLASVLQGTSVRSSDFWAQGVTAGLEWRY